MPGGEHFAAPPNWEWWILAYFFFGGIAGGSYAIGTLIRLAGAPADERTARIAFIVSFLALIPCPIFLTLDLGQPLRFWHMLVDTGQGALGFKYWSPMSVGSWVLLLFGLFSFVSFLGALFTPFNAFARGGLGLVWNVIGTVLGLFIAGYTGVLLAVSNQPVWSDGGWVLGGLFLASALSGSAALLLLVTRTWARTESATAVRIEAADRNFAILEAILFVLFLVFLVIAGSISKLLGVWLLLWVVVILGLAAPFVAPRMARSWPPATAPIVALLGVLALRALVIFAAQA